MAKLSGFNMKEKFNVNDHKELDNFSAIPADDYIGKLTESKNIRNKADTGSYLKMTFELTEGEFKGRKLWTNLNLDHPNSEAVDLSERALTSLIKACGKVAIEDTDELHGIEIVLKVSKKPASANYPESNEIKNYFPMEGVATPSSTKPKDVEGEHIPAKNKQRVSFG